MESSLATATGNHARRLFDDSFRERARRQVLPRGETRVIIPSPLEGVPRASSTVAVPQESTIVGAAGFKSRGLYFEGDESRDKIEGHLPKAWTGVAHKGRDSPDHGTMMSGSAREGLDRRKRGRGRAEY